MFPQMLNPALPVMLDRRFRAALLHALDREEMAASIMAGWAGVAHTQVTPAMSEYEQVQDAVTRYEFDPRRTTQLLEELGYRRGQGGVWQDATGQRLAFQNWATSGDPPNRVRGMLVASDYWKQAGIDVEPFLAPPGMDRGERAVFPAMLTRGGGGDYRSLHTYFHSTQAPVAENRYAGSNTSRIMDLELDRLLGRFFTSVPRSERVQALREMARYHTENVYWMGYYYNPQFTLLSNRLRDVTPSSFVSKAFNAHLWDIR
jgi:peptide/nickel transport system substrate-binding protein